VARSTYVYVVLDGQIDERPIAGFTVKHELVTWLQRTDVRGLRVFRLRDGSRDAEPTQLSVASLLEGGQ
jgi:hypothetical protein